MGMCFLMEIPFKGAAEYPEEWISVSPAQRATAVTASTQPKYVFSLCACLHLTNWVTAGILPKQS